MSKHFIPTKVKGIYPGSDDSVIVTLDIPAESQSDFQFAQGQYLTLKATINGEDIQRSYSLCSSPNDKEWKVGIKLVPGGKFSTFANQELQVGDVLQAMKPDGRFTIDIEPESQKNYLAFAGGSGITPILSIIKTHLEREPNSSFKLFYSNKRSKSIMLKEELEALKNIFMERLEIFYFLTQEKRNIPFLNGRINEDKLDIIFKAMVDKDNCDDVFICGPEPIILLVRNYLVEKGLSKDKLHFELFTSSNESQQAYIKESKSQFAGKTSQITVIEGGKTLEFEIPQGSENILDAALDHSADLPFACKGGVCCTCKAKLLEGEVNLLVNYGLEQYELDDGYILSCQAIPISDKVTVDFDS